MWWQESEFTRGYVRPTARFLPENPFGPLKTSRIWPSDPNRFTEVFTPNQVSLDPPGFPELHEIPEPLMYATEDGVNEGGVGAGT